MIPVEPIVPITSREYKMMLLAERLSGTKETLANTLADLRRAIEKTTKLEVKGEFEPDKEQEVRFWDSSDNWLRNTQGVVLRTRVRDQTTSLTLKCRHGDRYFVQSRIGTASDAKFEEDLKPRFISLFSHSRKVVADAPVDIGKLFKRFPDIKNRLATVDETLPLNQVRGFTAKEHVYTGVKISLTPQFDAEAAVVLWYDFDEGDDQKPLIAEFSFRYPRKKWRRKPPAEPHNAFDGVTGLAAHDFYTALQDSDNLSTAWLDPRPITKTRFAYEG